MTLMILQQHLLSSVINIHAPLKQRYLPANQVPYMNGQLRKAIHQRSMWRNKHFKDKRNPFDRAHYVRCRNNVVKLTKLSVNTYFKNKCKSCHGNSKQFFKTVRPFLSDNSNNRSGNNILLNENGKIVSDASEVAEIFNTFYGSIAGYPVNCDDGLNDISPTDAINKHCMHDSVINIKGRVRIRKSKSGEKWNVQLVNDAYGVILYRCCTSKLCSYKCPILHNEWALKRERWVS